jgi:hypothetical protein
MSVDPIISAVSHNWILTIGFVVSLTAFYNGYMRLRLERRWPGLNLALLLCGLVGFVDCLIRAMETL